MAVKVSFLSMKTQFENLGDALINRELIALLSEHGRLIVDVSSTPDWFVQMLSLPGNVTRTHGRFQSLMLMCRERLAGNEVFYFFLPGGHIGEYSLLRFLKRTLILLPYFLLKIFGIRFCQIGSSLERLGTRHQLYLKLRQRLMHAFFVRDINSSQFLKNARIRHNGILPDLAFNLFADSKTEPNGTGNVCFSFRTDQHPAQFDECYSLIEQAVRVLPKETSYYFSVQVERDKRGVEGIRSRLQEHHGISAKIFHETRNIPRMQDFYLKMDVVISNRLHVLLLGASVCGRLVAYADQMNQKISGLFKTINREELLLSRQSAQEDKLLRALSARPLDGYTEKQKLIKGVASIFSDMPLGVEAET